MATAPTLPGYRSGLGVTEARGNRITSSSINTFARDPTQRAISLAAKDAIVPIVYGRANVPGQLFAQGMISTDLVLGYMLCVGEIDAVEMVQINDVNASTITGVTVTTYLGTPTQTVNATLSSAIPAYNDSLRFDVGNGLRGIAYVVLRITSAAAVGGWPRLRATIRGRKVYDPRTSTTVYSNNTALCMADLISDVDYGLGLTVANVADAANWCDSLLSDGATKRSQISLVLDRPRAILPDWLDLLSTYAECFWINEGASIKLVRDSAVALGATPIEREWIAGSLSIKHDDTADSPKAVEVIYTVPRTDALPWAAGTAKRALTGGSAAPTTLRLEGVISIAEADNKALSKLNRMQSRITISCEIPDRGVSYQAGDVIRLDNAARGISLLPMRILSIDLSAAGRYRLSGELYDPSHYPSETPPVAGASLPAGAIILWDGGDAPSGFSDYTAANGKLLIGAGGALAQGETGGTGWSVTISGNTSPDVAHGTIDYSSRLISTGSSSGDGISNAPPTPYTGPAHGYSTGAITVTPRKRQQRLIKATITQDNVPVGGKLFGVAGIAGSGWLRDTSNSGRLIEAAASNANIGAASQNVPITTASANDSHWHHTIISGNYGGQTIVGYDLNFNPVWSGPICAGVGASGGPHTHTANVNVEAQIKRAILAIYQNSADAQLLPGHIVAWEGGALPTDWVLCDGTNGTPDCRDYFIQIAGSGNESTNAGDNTVAATATTSNVSHAHNGGDQGHPSFTGAAHRGNVSHNHTINATVPLDPPYYALAFILFSPGA